MSAFEHEYRRLNSRQRLAVDTIEGPVLVVAGPGTGKTQLLGMRVARILEATDSLPENILCLTFSESGQVAMRRRLEQLMPAGLSGRVTIQTFHGFSAEIMARYPDYFYRGAEYQLADELKQYELLQAIFRDFQRDHPLHGYRENRYTQAKATQSKIKELKNAGLTPAGLLALLDHNDLFLDFAEPQLNESIGGQTITKKLIPALHYLSDTLVAYRSEPMPTAFIEPLSNRFNLALAAALTDSVSSTKPLTEWKSTWRDSAYKNEWRFKARAQQAKLRAVDTVYETYQAQLAEQQLYDYEDMIIQTLEGLETHEALRNTLQEQYLYILVDEYQDTNQAQLRMIRMLADHDVNEGRPNLMVVGDDDQAIYKFQGADLGNMVEFNRHYPTAERIVLKDNYRSGQLILDAARQVIIQGRERLENLHEDVSKALTARSKNLPAQIIVEQPLFADAISEHAWIAETIKAAVDNGTAPQNIAIIGRWHKDLLAIIPHLRQAGLPVEYERRDNMLESPHINRLVRLVELVQALANQRFQYADALLPEILTFEFWHINPADIWQVSFAAYHQHRSWLELIEESNNAKLMQAAAVLKAAALAAHDQPLEAVLDILLGAPGGNNDIHSPYYEYYFNAVKDGQSDTHTTLLSQLITLRRHLHDFRPDAQHKLADFLEFVHLHRAAGISIIDTHSTNLQAEAVQVMTAHKAKGLEFDQVFILNCQENVWGKPVRARPRLISYPPNLRVLEPAGDVLDDWLRLFFVAMTRARSALYLPCYEYEADGRAAVPLSFLQIDPDNALIARTAYSALSEGQLATALQSTWLTRHLSSIQGEKSSLQSRLDEYHLSATHLNNFLDLQYAGPPVFIADNLLQFPGIQSPEAAFGTAMHAAMKTGHALINNGKKLTAAGLYETFTRTLRTARLNSKDEQRLQEQGRDLLNWLAGECRDLWRPGQIAEQYFPKYSIVMDGVRLSGSPDVLEINKDTVHVIDYKTGRPDRAWSIAGEPAVHKLRRYKRQLIFYKLLVENSSEPIYRGKKVTSGELIFLEPPKDTKEIVRLRCSLTEEDAAYLRTLIKAVWRCIMLLDFPDTSGYKPDAKGTRQFEADLLSGTV